MSFTMFSFPDNPGMISSRLRTVACSKVSHFDEGFQSAEYPVQMPALDVKHGQEVLGFMLLQILSPKLLPPLSA